MTIHTMYVDSDWQGNMHKRKGSQRSKKSISSIVDIASDKPTQRGAGQSMRVSCSMH